MWLGISIFEPGPLIGPFFIMAENKTIIHRLRQLPDLVKYSLFLLTAIAISLLCPSEVQFGFDYEQGETWRQADLIASTDVPLLKFSEEVAQETERVKADFIPYYVQQTEVAKKQKKAFEEAFKKQLEQSGQQFPDVKRNSGRYLTYSLGLLDRIYDRGIILLDPQHQGRANDLVVNILKGNATSKQPVQRLLNSAGAQELITDSLPYSRLYEAEFLLPILPQFIQPNIVYNDSVSQRFLQEELASIMQSNGIIEKGELIVGKGEIITQEAYQRIYSYEEYVKEDISTTFSYYSVFAGYFLLSALIMGAYLVYLLRYHKEMFERINGLLFVLFFILAYSYLIYAVESTEVLSAYIIPFAIVPIVIKIFYDEWLALFTYLIIILIDSFISSLGYEFTILQLLVGIVAILSNSDTRNWSGFFRTMIYIYLTYALAYIGLSLMQEGGVSLDDGYFFVWIFLNAFLTLLAYPMVPLLERLFGFTSSISLIELSDMNRPLLRELAIKAPGTLQHSLQVANLSEAAADKIGADALLVKVAALYHDIGKTSDATYFIENQSGNNPHDELDHLASAKMIIGHVTEGMKMAKKARLPKVLSRFIETHHGTTRVEYFYRNFIKENPDREFDESIFRYPGPKPNTKEETILMLADSLEAASKSLKNPTGKDIDELVGKIIGGKIAHGQLEDSALTFSELEACKEVFMQRLRSMNHVRVEYPKEERSGN